MTQPDTSEQYKASWTADTKNRREINTKERMTALSRCKSFLGLKTDKTGFICLTQEETNNSKDKNMECSFVLKSTNETVKQINRIKR